MSIQVNTRKKEDFRKKIWDFYTKNKRNFPWRETSNPYHILVSEIMLQQTQTSRVLPKYEEFLKKFPTLNKLARATNEDVLRLWSGLGYNRRALYLKAASEKLSQNSNYHPVFLKTLKGIGENTAGAIYVFSTNKPYVFIETNIRRVFIHEFFKDQEKVSDKDILKLIEATLPNEKSLPAGRQTREWYYALMDYGVYLSKTEVNPNRKSKHYFKQSKFSGSLRQARGYILKILLEKKVLELKKLEENIKSAHAHMAIDQLEKEGFISKKDGKIFLKS